MNVLIVARTKMSGTSRCIGGLAQDGTSLRLLTSSGDNHDTSAPFQMGQIWELTYVHRSELIAPHVEDVLVTSMSHVCNVPNLGEYILKRITPWQGSVDQLFGGVVEYTGKDSGYVSRRRVPTGSTGFWIPDCDLKLRDDKKHYDYVTRQLRRGLSYVGEASPIENILAGTLVRVSLARWWKPRDAESGFEERCYLQLSGWY